MENERLRMFPQSPSPRSPAGVADIDSRARTVEQGVVCDIDTGLDNLCQ